MNPASPLLARSAIALGNFDGVHVGHRRILEMLRAHAARHGLRPLALTFDPHPRHFFSPSVTPALLTPPREKAALIAALGVEQVTLPFDASLAALSAEEFFHRILRGALGGETFFLGPGHRFGQGARGDASLLRVLGAESSVHEIPPVSESGEIVSSSAIRALLESGTPEAIQTARRMLGRPYALEGRVIRCHQRGRLIGFPTANLQVEDPRKILPAFGVYGGYARFKGEKWSAVGNIGLRPTFSGTEPSIEVHIPEWEGDLYGQFLEFDLERPLRPEMKFESVEALKTQIGNDVKNWKNLEKTGF